MSKIKRISELKVGNELRNLMVLGVDKYGDNVKFPIGNKIIELNDKVEELGKPSGSNELMVSVTWSELKELRDSRKLVAGTHYRITDYECTTTQTNTRSANYPVEGHKPFDIIVQALDERTLSENARAIQRDGDTYFANAKLEAWQLKYALDNDASRFAWAKEEIKERPAKWSCGWGVLEERYDDGASTNYTATTIDGTQKYLYRPSQPTSYLEGKTFYRYEGQELLHIEDASELYFVTRGNPFETGEQTEPLLVIYAPTGRIIRELKVTTEYGEASDDNDEIVWNTYFGDELDMKTYGQTIDINGETYYSWVPWSDDNYALDEWVFNNSPFALSEGTKIVYNGSTDSLYYAFDGIIGKFGGNVYEVTDGNHIYKYEDEVYGEEALLDTISYTNYIAPREGGKGVIYRLIDEHNNDCPFDFKNMQFWNNNEWYYTFSFKGKDISTTDYCYNNYIADNKATKWDDTTTRVPATLPMLILNAKPNARGATSGIANCHFVVGIKKGYISATRIENFEWKPRMGGSLAIIEKIYINLSGIFYGNSISGRCKEFVVGTEDAPASAFYDNEIHLATYQSNNFTCNASTFVNNKLDLTESSAGFVITAGSMTSCNITNTFYEKSDAADKIDFGANAIMRDCVIKMYNALTINYANTTSTTEPLRFLNIDARGWGKGTSITIPSTFPVNADYELKVAKNSNGEVKMWCDADLIE